MISLAFYFLIRTFLFQSFIIPSESMKETLFPGDMILVEKIDKWTGKDYQYGDIVVFDFGFEKHRLVKRIIGLPGDVIDIENGELFLNGEKSEESYVGNNKTMILDNNNGIIFPYMIPEDSVFLMGDNREESSDSRVFGAVRIKDIDGKVFLRYWPLSSFGKIE